MPSLTNRFLLIIAIGILSLSIVEAQNNYCIVFYNVENLFDTRDDSITSDEEFLPQSMRHWTRSRFENKIRMIYKALITAGEGQFPDIIGLAEVENSWVVEQLITRTPLNKVPYGIIHKESPDPRGIDVALLYRKDRIIPVDLEFIPISEKGKNSFVSRDILHFTAKMGNTPVHFFVNHWPSRSGGYTETKDKRNSTAAKLRERIDTLIRNDPGINLLLMGDFNATPNEKCIISILKALPYPGNYDPDCLVNLSTTWTYRSEGTIRNGGQWELFDQMICSKSLIRNEQLMIGPDKGRICDFEFLLEPDPTHLGKKPFRTFMGPVFHGGISDHLPVKISLISK